MALDIACDIAHVLDHATASCTCGHYYEPQCNQGAHSSTWMMLGMNDINALCAHVVIDIG